MSENASVQVYERLSVEVSPVVQEANAIQVFNAGDYDNAAVFLIKVKEKSKLVEAERVKVSKPMNEALRAHNDLFGRLSTPLEMAERTVKNKMTIWYGEQQRKREEAERQARDKARREEEAERERLQKQAAAAEAKGRTERAEELKQRAAAVYVEPAPVAISAETSVVTGNGSVNMRQGIKVEVVNPFELLEAIMKEEMPLSWISFDLQAIKRRAMADKLPAGSTKIPGVRVMSDINSAVRTRATAAKFN
jgi:hypothetical protein